MPNITFELQKHISILSSNEAKGRTKELNLVSWNGRPAKYDIRDWENNHSKMGKGITLTETELRELYAVLQKMFENKSVNEPVTTNKQNIETEFSHWFARAPIFLQEVKNIVIYLSENGYTEEETIKVFFQDSSMSLPEALKNEIDNMKTVYNTFYPEFIRFIREMNEDELELFFILLETKN